MHGPFLMPTIGQRIQHKNALVLLILTLRFTPPFMVSWRPGRQRVGVLLFNMRVRVKGNLLVSLASALGSSPRPAIQKKRKGECDHG